MIRTFIFLSALSFSALNAQTLTQVTHEPEVGNTEKVRQLDTAAFSSGLPLSVIGPNSFWDFSKAQALNTETLTNNYVTPSTFTHGALFPDANIVQDLPGNMFSYFKFSMSPGPQTELVGVHRPDIVMSFSNSALVVQYPAGLGFSVTDNVSGTYSIGTITGPVNGETKTMADGTGTLMLGPGAVFNDVIRLKSVQTLTLTQGTLTGNMNQTVYNYYSASQRFPILNITYISMSIGLGSPSVTAGMFANADNFATVGIAENTNNVSLQVYPNPASERLYIDQKAGEIKAAALYDLTGKKVLGEAQKSIDISSLPCGVYFLKLETTEGIAVKKIVVAR